MSVHLPTTEMVELNKKTKIIDDLLGGTATMRKKRQSQKKENNPQFSQNDHQLSHRRLLWLGQENGKTKVYHKD